MGCFNMHRHILFLSCVEGGRVVQQLTRPDLGVQMDRQTETSLTGFHKCLKKSKKERLLNFKFYKLVNCDNYD